MSEPAQAKIIPLPCEEEEDWPPEMIAEWTVTAKHISARRERALAD
jgi:hypothetical protein